MIEILTHIPSTFLIIKVFHGYYHSTGDPNGEGLPGATGSGIFPAT